MESPALTVLFCAAAGPRLGFGHLIRCGVLAGELGVRADVALRAAPPARRTARALGWRVHRAHPAILRSVAPELVVVDDPSPTHARRWIRAAALRQVPVVVIRDLGYPVTGADLVVDGSIARAVDGPDADLQGPDFALLDRAIAELRRANAPRQSRRVVIGLGGGAHVRGIGVEIGSRICARASNVTVELAPGFGSAPLPKLAAGCQWIGAHALRPALATATVAVVGGGITLYEACALRTPTVSVAVADPQRVTISAVAARGAAIDASGSDRADAIDRAAHAVIDLLETPDRASSLAAAAGRLVDGQGTARVATHIRALVLTHPGRRARHAA